MDEVEVNHILTFLNAEFREPITKERRAVWLEMTKDIPYSIAFTAAKVLIARLNKFAGINEFLKAVAEVTTPIEERETWGEAWDKWVSTSKRFGMYRLQECEAAYRKVSPRGADVMSTSMMEWFTLPNEDIGIFRAQFRQRYETLAARANHQRVLPKDIQEALGYKVTQAPTNIGPGNFESAGRVAHRIIQGGKK